jgi:DNA primase
VPVPAERGKKLKPAHYNAERLLIAHMLRSRTIAAKVREKLAGQSVSVSEHQKIADCLYDFYENGNLPNLSHFLALLPDEGLQKLTAEIAMLPVKEEPEEQELNDYIKSVLNYQKLLKIKEKEREGKQAEREHNYRKAAEIAMEILQLRKSL